MDSSILVSVYRIAGGAMSAAMFAISATLFAFQLQAWRRTRHRSLRWLMAGSAIAMLGTLAVPVANALSSEPMAGLYIGLANMPVVLLQALLALIGNVLLLRAFAPGAGEAGPRR